MIQKCPPQKNCRYRWKEPKSMHTFYMIKHLMSMEVFRLYRLWIRQNVNAEVNRCWQFSGIIKKALLGMWQKQTLLAINILYSKSYGSDCWMLTKDQM